VEIWRITNLEALSNGLRPALALQAGKVHEVELALAHTRVDVLAFLLTFNDDGEDAVREQK
jgi:hypothetical protein